MKNKKSLYSIIAFATLLVSCNHTAENSSNNSSLNEENYYDNIESRAPFDKENKNNFMQTFKNGLDDNLFYALEGAWHTDVQGAEHEGMKHRNLFYTNDENDDYLAIRALGNYAKNKEDPSKIGLPEGGCIVSKNHLGPGRYEIEMAAMPREGGVTAMWTYCTTTGNENSSQNEIDIEIGGTTDGTNFKNMWCTSWTKKTVKDTDTVDVSDTLYLNDRKIHKYTFDWYTNYDSDGTRQVDWFIDGKLIKQMKGNVVPEHEMPLWIGVWFPPLWAGKASFDEDYMLIKSISYQAFDQTSQYFENCRSNPVYNKVAPSSLNIPKIDFKDIKDLNLFSNGDMESLDISSKDKSYFGWIIDQASKGSVELTNGNNSEHGFKLTASSDTSSKYHGEYLVQEITNAYEGYKYKLSIDAKKMSESSSGNIEIRYKNAGGKTLDTIILPIDSLEYKSHVSELTMPKDSFKLEITITSENGEIAYDNASLVFVR